MSKRCLYAALAAVMLVVTTLGVSVQASDAFEFQKGDTVAILGNGLADRMQHDAWTETVLQSELKGLDVSFRNLGFSGDQVDQAPRNRGSITVENYVKHVKADVIFVMFGYNEAFAGVGQADAYRTKLVNLVKTYRGLQSSGETAPRFVLFSPIAFEATGNPNYPDGLKQNQALAAFSEATRVAAEEAGVMFVDLYGPTFHMFDSNSDQLTLNGAHLNEEGNRLLSQIIAKSLFGKPVAASKKLSGLRDAVKDKNWNWHNRYRATDGNDVWGGRSKLSFTDKQSNKTVLMHELTMLDVLTANRDKQIWAVAQAKEYKVDDSNVSPPIEVKTNVAKSNGKTGNLEYQTPEASIAGMKTPEGYKLQVFASEVQFPDLANPVQMQVDAKGRLWAASWNTYPKWEPLKPMNDCLMILPDEDRDGVADKRIIFAYVHNPLGFEFWNGGVLVTSGPDLIFLKDTDGDDKADVRYVMLQGVGTSDTHHAANNLVMGPDGGIYWQSGIFLVHNYEHPWSAAKKQGGSGMYRFDPRRFTINFHAGNSPNPHGTSFDYWGYCYANDGTGGKSYQVRPEGKGFKMHTLLKKEFRPVAADAIISSTHFPEDMQGDFLICNTIGKLVVKQYKLNRDGFEDRQVGQVWGTPVKEIINSEGDRNFRPTDAVFGEDGALYVSDWQNVIIGHMQHNIRDPNRDHSHGRIVRVTVDGRPLQKAVKIDGESVTTLIKNLEHPVDGVRHRTRVELTEHDSDEVLAAVAKWSKGFDANNEDEAHHLLEALWQYQSHNVRNEELLNKLLASKVDHARIAAETVKHFWFTVDATSGRVVKIAAEGTERKPLVVPDGFSSSEAKVYKAGAEVFHRDAHCITCHQADGKGLAAIYPPLAGSAWVTGDEQRLIKATLHGLYGKIEVNGVTYDPAKGVPPMTAFGGLLDDKEMAAVLTYVRNTWGNKAPAVSHKTVKKVRSATKKQTTFWKPADLLNEHPMAK